MDRIGDFRIEQPLLTGSRGALWLAVEEATGRRLALHLASAAGTELAAPPAGAHLAEVLAAGTFGDGLAWYTTSWDATSIPALDASADNQPPVPEALQARIEMIEALLDALMDAHGAGRLHLGLRPACLRLDETGALRVLGFGLGLADLDAADGTLDAACVAPELRDPDAAPDARCDLFAVAALAHQMFTGVPPQPAPPDPDQMVDRILSGGSAASAWADPASLAPELPAGLARWLLRGLQPTPEDRFDDAHAMRAALRPAPEEEEPTAPAPETLDDLLATTALDATQRAQLRALAEDDAPGTAGTLDEATRRALRDAAAAAGMAPEHLEGLLLGRYRPRRAASARRPDPVPRPEPEEVVQAALDVAPRTSVDEAASAPRDEAPVQRSGALVAIGAIAVLAVWLVSLMSDGGDEDAATDPTGTTTSIVAEAAPATADSRGGERFSDALASGAAGPELVVIPAGSFRMGCVSGERCAPDELPVHEVRIGRAFAIGVHEITFEEYDRFVAATGGVRPGDERWGRGRHPAINVSWDEAQQYVAWLSAQTGARYRLPTEAEWEYAARAGSETPWFFGDDPEALCRHGNGADALTSYDRRNDRCNDGVGRRTAEVGSYEANAFGLHDTVGNLWEWVEDCYVGSHEGAPADGSARQVEGPCPTRLLRGGGLNSGPDELRSANRERNSPTLSLYYIGFRVVREL